MYKELEKYRTGKIINVPAVLHKLDGTKEETTYQANEYSFKLGELLNDFIIHKNRGWLWKFWHGTFKYDQLTRIYTKWLNSWGIGSDSCL